MFLCLNLIFTLVCLTIDRYLAVIKPLRHRIIMARRTAYRMLVAVYLLAFLLAVVPILSEARYKYHPGTNHCSPAWTNSCGYGAAMTTIAFILPIIGMLITYTRIFLTLRNKRVLMSKSPTSTMSSKDMQDLDSNSLGNFEDTSTDPSGDYGIRLTACKNLVHSKDDALEHDLQPGVSLENLVEKDSTVHHATGKQTACKINRESKEYLVKGSSSKQLDHGLETWTSDEHLAKEESAVNDLKDEVNKGLGDDSVTGEGVHPQNKGDAKITYIDVIGTDEESSRLKEPEKVNNDVTGTRLLKLSEDNTTDNLAEKDFVSNMAGKESKSSVPARNSPKGAAIAGIRPQEQIPSTTSSDHESDVFNRDETGIADNKQVSFQDSIKESSSKSKVKKEDAKRRLSGIFPVSRKAINALVSRMKQQRAIRHEYKVARTGTILVVSFLILWMPYVIAHLCFVGNSPMLFYNIATFLVYTNALANPIIYALTNRAVMEDIRNSMGRLCTFR